MYTFISHSENDTINFAKELTSKLNNGDTILLCGELGSGKTKFTQGVLEYFGLENEISSPTFTIVNEHHKDGINIYHFEILLRIFFQKNISRFLSKKMKLMLIYEN